MKKILKKLLPEPLLLQYHRALAAIATLAYGFPAKKMVVIGITGTKGKTSTANFVWSCLMAGGLKTGILTTANIRIGEEEIPNDKHMSMPGRFAIQRWLARMREAGCTHVVVETTSEGLKQFRNVGVYYDIAVFTNLTPEHLSSHGGSFENYKRAKLKLFAALSAHEKRIGGRRVGKVMVANADSEHAGDFLAFPADKKITYSLTNKSDYCATNIEEKGGEIAFDAGGARWKLNLYGKFNILNALPAIAIAREAGIPDGKIAEGLSGLRTIPGRMEKIDEGQNFLVFADYAHEKQSMTRALEAAAGVRKPGGRTIVTISAQGGGRDIAKRPQLGEVAANMADFVIATNDDPYEDDPKRIVEDLAGAAVAHGKVRDENVFAIEDRRLGIRKALELAKPGDVVMITGKGAEKTMIVGKRAIPWDEREIIREEIRKLLGNG